MPTLNIKKRSLFEALGQQYTDEEFSELCFSFGLELDDVVAEKSLSDDNSEEIVYKIDIPANRYDLLCLEGLSTALLVFTDKLRIPRMNTIVPISESIINVNVNSSVDQVRPFIVAAVLRNITFTAERYDSFIDFQDKLHHNICRKRSLVAIGTHDLDTVKPPFHYVAKPPDEIRFRALNQNEEHTAAELMEIYANHPQLKQYLHIINDKPVYPVVLDSDGIVLSLPPIINGHHSRISVNTKNVFIECTATDLTKAIIVLDTLVYAFSKYCEDPYTVECCSVVNGGKQLTYPELKYRKKTASVKEIDKYLGISSDNEELVRLLNRMCLQSISNKSEISIEVPPFRHDIIHACDVIEDVAIAYGYNNIPKTVPSISLVAEQLPLNKLTEQLRQHIAFSGFIEALTFSLCSIDDVARKSQKDINNIPAVHISNPKTLEFEVARTSLLPGLLKTISSNKHIPLPLKVFEVSDVVLKDPTCGVGAKNERRIGAVYYGKTAGFEIIHGLLDKIMQTLEIPRDKSNGYYLELNDDETFFPERCAKIMYKTHPVGTLGILHPHVVTNFDLTLPCSSLELNVEPFI